MKVYKKILYLIGGLIASLILCCLYILILKYFSAQINNPMLDHNTRSGADDGALFVGVIGPLLLFVPMGYALSKVFFEYFISENIFKKIKNIIIAISVVLGTIGVLWLFFIRFSATDLLKISDYARPLIFAGVAVILLFNIGWARFFAFRRYQRKYLTPQPIYTQIKETAARAAIHGASMSSFGQKIVGVYVVVLFSAVNLFILVYDGGLLPRFNSAIGQMVFLIVTVFNAAMLSFLVGVIAQWRVPVPIMRKVSTIFFIPNLILSALVFGAITLSKPIYGEVIIYLLFNLLIVYLCIIILKRINHWIIGKNR